jgi:predicted transcriptional regulator
MAKVLVTIPDDLLARIDRAAERCGRSRSAWVRDAAEQALEADRTEAFAAIERARAALSGLGPFDAAAEIRASRDERDLRDRGR